MRLLLAACLLLLPLQARADDAGKPIARVLLALYDSREESSPATTEIHRFLEMPANQLGFDIHYADINAPLPVPGDDVRGIVLWFDSGYEVPDVKRYLDWLEQAVSHGKKLVILENAGIGDKWRRSDDAMHQYNRILSAIGIQDGNSWNAVTYHSRIDSIDKSIAGFERQIGPVLPPFGDMHIIPGKATSHLRMVTGDGPDTDVADLITTSPNGGFVSEDYAIFYVVENEESKISQWFVNPFEFLRLSLDAPLWPIPDITTEDGRRIFYSHIDGDGWNNISEIPAYNAKQMIAAEVIEKDILEAYSDFAFTVGLITADIDMDCYGVADSERVARNIFALANVEPASHTHTHPLFWRFFADYTPEKEKPLLGKYPPRPKEMGSMLESLKADMHREPWHGDGTHDAPHAADVPVKPGKNDDTEAEVLRKYYRTPRSYACQPFDLNDEIVGSVARVNQLTPPGKKAQLIQWPGDTTPFERALAVTREAGLYNINGGDSRFDTEYPSYSSVAPTGLLVGRERQIYSSNSNENTYTNLWTGRFFGFRYLQDTVLNTERPLRVKPFNLYFHMYSGQKQASLNALKENLQFARTQPLIPITATEFAAIADGFYNAQVETLGNNRWKINHRGALQTVRFDHAANLAVDFATSQGVLGQIYTNGSLYVSLSPTSEDSIISLINNPMPGNPPQNDTPYLINSRWPIKSLQYSKNLLTIMAQGYGKGEMSWKMPAAGRYRIRAYRRDNHTTPIFETQATANDTTLEFAITGARPSEPLEITIEKIQD